MSTRRDLLAALFQKLAARDLPYCVLRNAREVFQAGDSDVDLLTAPAQVAGLLAAGLEAADATGFKLVQRTRFVNHSFVFWNGKEAFVRVDVDTEIRWCRFHILSAVEVLKRRRSRDGVFVSDPGHEAVILLTQALWVGRLSTKYSERLEELRSDPTNWLTEFEHAFGLRENLLLQCRDPDLSLRLREAVRRYTRFHPARIRAAVCYGMADAVRFWQRWHRPPGVVLRVQGASDINLDALRQQLAVLFPIQKGLVGGGTMPSLSLRKCLFKGGLAIESLGHDGVEAGPLSRPGVNRQRAFFSRVLSPGQAEVWHVGTGRRQSVADFVPGVSAFICETLARECQVAREK